MAHYTRAVGSNKRVEPLGRRWGGQGLVLGLGQEEVVEQARLLHVQLERVAEADAHNQADGVWVYSV